MEERRDGRGHGAGGVPRRPDGEFVPGEPGAHRRDGLPLHQPDAAGGRAWLSKGALEVIDSSEDIDNLRFGNWFSAIGQNNGSVGVVLGVREVNNGAARMRRPPWERDCARSPYRFGPPRRTRDATGTIREECDLFQFWSHHPGEAHFLYADSSAHFLAYEADAVPPALATRAGGELVRPP